MAGPKGRNRTHPCIDEVLRNMAEGVVLFNAKDGTIVHANERFERMLGYGRGELNGLPAYKINYGYDGITPEKVAEMISRRLRESGEAAYEVRNVRKDGTPIWCYVQTSGLKHPEYGDIWVAVHLDITARRRAEEDLRKSEGLFRTLFRRAPLGIATAGTDGRFLDVNEEFCRMLGYSRPELLELRVQDITHSDDMERTMRLSSGLFAGTSSGYSIEKRYLKKDGTPVWVSVTTAPIFDDEGRIVRGMGFIQDISARRVTQDLLRAERDLVLSVNAGATVDQTLDLCLEAAIRASGMDCGGLYLFDESDGSLVLRRSKGVSARFVEAGSRYPSGSPRSRLVRSGRPVYTRYRQIGLGLSRDQIGEGLEALAVIPLIFQGRVIGCLNLASHVRKEVPAELRTALESAAAQIAVAIERAKAQEDLVESTGRLRALAGRLARAQEAERRRLARELHDDIGQALTALGMSLESVNCQWLEKCSHEPRRRIREAASQLGSITEQIRGVIAGLYPPVLDDYGLADALRWYGREYSARTGTKIIVRGPVAVRGLSKDAETGLFRIAQEALANVVKHSGASAARVTLSQKGSRVRLTVRDNGTGLAAAPANNKAHWGMLSMRERAADAGGTLRIESVPGQGTSIIVVVEGGKNGHPNNPGR